MTRDRRVSDVYCSRLAFEDPERLLGLITGGSVATGCLARAAEIAGREIADDLNGWVEDVLLWLLHHESSLVREGAVYGLEDRESPRAREVLESTWTIDPDGVRDG